MTEQERDALIGKALRRHKAAQSRVATLDCSLRELTKAWREVLPSLDAANSFRVGAEEIVVERPDPSYHPQPGHAQRAIRLATLKREHADYAAICSLLKEIEKARGEAEEARGALGKAGVI